MPPVSRAPKVVKTASGERSIRITFWLGMATAVATSVLFIILGRVVDVVMHNHDDVVQRGLLMSLGDSGYGWVLPVTIGLVIIAGISEFIRVAYAEYSATREEILLRKILLRRLFVLGPQKISTEEIGSVVSTCTDGVERVAKYRQTYLGTLWAGFAVPALTLVLMAVFVDWKTALILLATFPLIPVLLVIFKMVMKRFGGNQRHARNQLAAAYLEAIQGLETLTLLGATKRMGDKLRLVGEENRQAIMKMLAGNQLILFVVDSGFNLCLITVATASVAVQGSMGVLSIGQIMATIALTVLLLEPMDQLAGFFYVGMGGMANQRKIGRFFGEGPNMVRGLKGLLRGTQPGHPGGGHPGAGHPGSGHPGAGHPGAAASFIEETEGTPTPVDTTNLVPVHVDGDLVVEAGAVSIRDLHFAYDQSHPIVYGLDLDVRPGEHIAICGPSGEGKSTLVHILKGTLRADSGKVAVNGCTTPNERRQASAYVAQSTWLFNDTIAANLRIANPDATDEDMYNALDQAYVGDDIRSMPQGLETWVGDRGFGLSGGQMQRLSLARALLSGKRVLILDEPTSQVDLISEEKIVQAIARISADKTVIMITHRQSSLRGIDKVYHIKGGRLWEGGDHGE